LLARSAIGMWLRACVRRAPVAPRPAHDRPRSVAASTRSAGRPPAPMQLAVRLLLIPPACIDLSLLPSQLLLLFFPQGWTIGHELNYCTVHFRPVENPAGLVLPCWPAGCCIIPSVPPSKLEKWKGPPGARYSVSFAARPGPIYRPLRPPTGAAGPAGPTS